MLLLIATILISYFLFLLMLILGWSKVGRLRPREKSGGSLKISVVVALRNESGNVNTLLDSLIRQDFKNYEVILVDDHSTDDTRSLIEQHKKSNAFPEIVILTSKGTGKKAALTTGIASATGEIIVTTDADSLAGRNWLSIAEKYFKVNEVKMLAGGVRIQQHGTWFSDLQAIEFSSLIGSGASTLALGIPTMCNGANLAFRKSVFNEVGGYEGNMHIASGDDEFLMRKIADRYPEGVHFLADPHSVVTTKPAPTMSDFFQQRIRWAGKWRYNKSLFTKCVALYVVLVQAALIASLILLPTSNFPVLISLLTIRFALEALFLLKVCRLLNVRWSWPAFFILQFLYPVYVLVVGLASNLESYSWKQRRLSQSVS